MINDKRLVVLLCTNYFYCYSNMSPLELCDVYCKVPYELNVINMIFKANS